MIERPFQDAVDDEVGIAADRRREMRVLVKREREMAERIGRVSRLLERPQHQIGYDAFFGLAGDFFGQPLVVLRANGDVERARQRDGHLPVAASGGAALLSLCSPVESRRSDISMFHRHEALRKILDAQRIAERVRQLFELENLFRVGFFVNAVQRAETAALEVSRDRLVRGEHELLDQPVRDVAIAAYAAASRCSTALTAVYVMRSADRITPRANSEVTISPFASSSMIALITRRSSR